MTLVWAQLQLHIYFGMETKATNSKLSFIIAAVEIQAYIAAFWKRLRPLVLKVS